MRDTMGIILTGESEMRLGALTQNRAIAAVPIAGRYRIIDFLLSNMVNSGIGNVGVTTLNKYRSMMDHLGSGKEWDLNRKLYGLFILPPFMEREGLSWNLGNIDTLHGIKAYLQKSRQKYVLLTDSNIICNMQFYDLQRYHVEKGADITIVCNTEPDWNEAEYVDHTLFGVAETGRILSMDVRPDFVNVQNPKVSMQMYFMEKTTLESLISEGVARGLHNLQREILSQHINDMRIYAYSYDGYVRRIDNIASYYQCNMDLLNVDIRREVFKPTNPIYTKVRDEVPTLYVGGSAVNSMVADGCMVEGQVENSILFRGVRIGKGALVRNSIIMQDAVIQESAVVENAVLDKEVLMTRGVALMGTANFPIVVEKSRVIA